MLITRVRGYKIVRGPLRGPGVSFYQARDASGAPCLIQTAPLAAGLAGERRKYERRVAEATARLLIDEPQLGLRAHAASEDADGRRFLWWALDAPLGGFDASRKLGAEDFSRVCRLLLERLMRRHALGRTEPLLSHQTLVLPDADVLGVPVELDGGLRDEAELPRAPEEQGTCAQLGDLWRLGWAIEGVLESPDALSAAERAWVRDLKESNCARRISSAEAALSALNRLSEPLLARRATVLISEPPSESMTQLETDADVAWRLPQITDRRETETEIEPARAVLDRSPPTLRWSEPGGETPTVHLDPEDRDSSLDAEAASWTVPVLPTGSSPWSEVVSAHGAQRRSESQFTGFQGQIPGPRPAALDSPAALPERKTGLRRPAPTGRRLPFTVVVAVSLLILGGLVFWPRGPEVWLETGPEHQLSLNSIPRGAEVLAEADGRILGRTPLKFLVPPGADPVVLIAADGHVPERLRLPERGAITVELVPSASVNTCERVLETDEGIELMPGAHGARIRVAGGTVVRALEGDRLVGARLVRCTGSSRIEIGGRPGPVSIQIHADAPQTVVVDGRPVGVRTVSTLTYKAFTPLHLTGGPRYLVPTLRPVRVELPRLEPNVPVARAISP